MGYGHASISGINLTITKIEKTIRCEYVSLVTILPFTCKFEVYSHVSFIQLFILY
jgi:hypothetical protein